MRTISGRSAFERPFGAPLSEPPSSASAFVFQTGSLGRLRSLVLREAMREGLGEARAGDAVTAVNEVASNSLRHGGGSGRPAHLARPGTPSSSRCPTTGVIDDPLVGRVRPGCDAPGGRGLWMVNQLCELVQLRSSATGSTVRMHLRRPARPLIAPDGRRLVGPAIGPGTVQRPETGHKPCRNWAAPRTARETKRRSPWVRPGRHRTRSRT